MDNNLEFIRFALGETFANIFAYLPIIGQRLALCYLFKMKLSLFLLLIYSLFISELYD